MRANISTVVGLAEVLLLRASVLLVHFVDDDVRDATQGWVLVRRAAVAGEGKRPRPHALPQQPRCAAQRHPSSPATTGNPTTATTAAVATAAAVALLLLFLDMRAAAAAATTTASTVSTSVALPAAAIVVVVVVVVVVEADEADAAAREHCAVREGRDGR